MARSGAGIYSLPVGSLISNGETSDATDINVPIGDLAADANVARPIVAGGTGETSKSAFKASYNLRVGTELQAQNAVLQTIANLPATANRGFWRNASNVLEFFTLTSYFKNLFTISNNADLRTSIGLGDAATRAISFDIDYTVDGTALSPRYLTKQFVDATIAAQRLGGGQTWVTPARAHSTSYQNTTGRPIYVAVTGDAAWAGVRPFQVSSNNTTWITVGGFEDVGGANLACSAVIPSTWYYRVNGAINIYSWAELR